MSDLYIYNQQTILSNHLKPVEKYHAVMPFTALVHVITLLNLTINIFWLFSISTV